MSQRMHKELTQLLQLKVNSQGELHLDKHTTDMLFKWLRSVIEALNFYEKNFAEQSARNKGKSHGTK